MVNPERKTSRGSTGYVWSKDKTMQLIELFKSHSELWNTALEDYRNRSRRQKLQSEIAQALAIDVTEVVAKLHNLRCQYNAEIRKVKFKENYIPRWEYFAALRFLSNDSQPSTSSRRSESTDDVDNFESDDPTANENLKAAPFIHPNGTRRKKRSNTNFQNQTLMNNVVNILSKSADSHQIFGEYVADQMRGMGVEKCKRLKLTILKTIVKLEEEPDGSTDPLN